MSFSAGLLDMRPLSHEAAWENVSWAAVIAEFNLAVPMLVK